MDQVIPFPFILFKKKDSIILIDHTGVQIAVEPNDSLNTGDTLNLNEHRFHVLKKKEDQIVVFDLLDTLNFLRLKNGSPNPIFSATFEKSNSRPIDLEEKELINRLISTCWKYDVIEDENYNPNRDFKIVKRYHFARDSVIELTSYYYQNERIISEHQNFSYNAFSLDENLFLSFSKMKENPLPILQVTEVSDEGLELRSFASRSGKSIFFKKESNFTKTDFSKLLLESQPYFNCFDGYQGEYYFDHGVKFMKGNKFIMNFVNQNAPIEEMQKTGYIIVHFNVNCNKRIGDFGLIQMTENYKPANFSKGLIAHIVKKISLLKDWPSTYSTSSGVKYSDRHAFLMFKLNKGKIVDLCP